MDLAHAENSSELPAAAGLPGRQTPAFAALYDYWQSVRRNGAIPRAADFDLLALTNWLPEMSLLDIYDMDNVVCRFAGTAIVERMGMDISGQNIFNSQAEAMRDRASRAYLTATQTPCGAISHYTNHYSSGREGSVRTLYLPLETPAGGCKRLVSLTVQEENSTFAEPIERTITATQILSLEWIDLGFGLPPQNN